MGIRLVGRALGFEFGVESGDIENGFVSGLLELALAVGFNGFYFAFGGVMCILEATVAIISYGRQIGVEFA
jgi:hypothetical protein